VKQAFWIVALLISSLAESTGLAMSTNFTQFRVTQISMAQNNGNLFTGGISWNPVMIFTGAEPSVKDMLGVRLHAGVLAVKDQSGSIAPAFDVQVLGTVLLKPTTFEIGPGTQYFLGQGGYRLTANANLNIEIDWFKKFMKSIAYLVLGYTSLIDPNYQTDEFRIGLGLRI